MYKIKNLYQIKHSLNEIVFFRNIFFARRKKVCLMSFLIYYKSFKLQLRTSHIPFLIYFNILLFILQNMLKSIHIDFLFQNICKTLIVNLCTQTMLTDKLCKSIQMPTIKVKNKEEKSYVFIRLNHFFYHCECRVTFKPSSIKKKFCPYILVYRYISN